MQQRDISHIYDCFVSVGQKISTDTRKELTDSMFFCLSGERFNGNIYAEKAVELGAAFVITNNPNLNNERILWVEDPNQTLIDLATYHSEQLKTKFVAIGGSNGKTTTKELVNSVLSSKYNVIATPGNFNNHIGVPLTLLSVKPDCEIAIIELGTNHPGEMALLCNMFKADSALITNIGLEHLEGFDDIEAVAKEESEVYLMAQRSEAMAFVNSDDKWLQNMSKRLLKKKTYSVQDSHSDVYIKINQEMPNLNMDVFLGGVHTDTFETQLGGAFNAQNIASAISVGLYYDVPVDAILKALCKYKPSMNRSQWITATNGKQILLDAYNANPSSMEAGIKSFSSLKGSKTLLLGDMLELGKHSEREHLKIFELIQDLGISDFYLVGGEFKNALPSYPFIFDNAESLLAWLDTHPIESEYVYIKGSRGIAMEQCLDHFDLS